jgi:hypothetical protein
MSRTHEDRTRVLAHAQAGSPGAADAAGENPAGGRRPVSALDRFYRVTFADERGFRLWTERVVEFTSAVRDIIPAVLEMRPVIFAPLRPAPSGPIFAYVSAGARGLAAHISGGTWVDPTPVSVDALPRGLMMLFGEQIDADDYENRHA